jgi:hypothetical protein
MLSLTAPSLLEVLRRRVAENPARPSLSFLDASGAEAETLTWGELDRRVWAVARIGRHDHFFDQGVPSLLAARMAAALRDRFGIEVLLRTLFEKPAVDEIARAVAQSRIEEAAGPLAAGKGGARPKGSS